MRCDNIEKETERNRDHKGDNNPMLVVQSVFIVCEQHNMMQVT